MSEGLRLLEERNAVDDEKIAWLRDTAADAFACFERGEGLSLRREDVHELVQGALAYAHARSEAAHA